ncbi:MAG: hypothetical protein ACJATK_001644, partial [Paracoccaceae bacterium]
KAHGRKAHCINITWAGVTIEDERKLSVILGNRAFLTLPMGSGGMLIVSPLARSLILTLVTASWFTPRYLYLPVFEKPRKLMSQSALS